MNVMKRAWEIARKGVERFGGKVKEYFAEALRMAWAEVKKANYVHKMVVIGNKASMTYTVERYMGSERVEVMSDLSKVEYASVYKNFYRRGANVIDFFCIENGVKTFLGTKELAPFSYGA
ncbi:hypothetical protein WD019_03225 [Fictibacillus sp. Mic-4]|uniref:hypothetical protein n=1 Tax=Fictibacillus sp. Mic-4 TaxID=3132826 RepID=UPI003CF873F7